MGPFVRSDPLICPWVGVHGVPYIMKGERRSVRLLDDQAHQCKQGAITGRGGAPSPVLYVRVRLFG